MVVALFGPTGVGKTAVAIEVAARLRLRVISCDSMQLYRGLPVLTNQPRPEELSRVEHALIGVAGPDGEWTAAVYAKRAAPLIEEDLDRRGYALVVGGTGLYLRAALAPLSMARVCDPDVRAALEERGRTEGAEALHRELAALDPAAAERIHPRNLRRIVRALEVIVRDGPQSWSGRDDLWSPRYRHPTLIVGLAMGRDLLNARIDARARAMVQGGALEEVERHRAAYNPERGGRAAPPRGVAKAIGYAELCRVLDGDLTEEEAATRIAQATRRYAKRQVTWMRRLGDAVIIDTSDREAGVVADEVIALARAAADHDTGRVG